VDEENSRRCRTPYISSIYAGSLLSTKGKQLQKSCRNNGLRFNRIVTDDATCKAYLPEFASASWREATF
jgi:hypothetical protein